MMKREVLILAVWFVLLAGLIMLGTPQQPAAQVLDIKDYHGIPYVSGGVGLDEREELRNTRSDYNLRLVFAVKGGAYLSDVEVLIKDNQGKTVLEAISEGGPWLLTRLPAGTYSVSVTMSGKTLQQDTSVTSKGFRELHFYWD